MKALLLKTGVGNFRSVSTFFEDAGIEVSIGKAVNDILNADILIIPGAASFGSVMASINEAIKTAIHTRYQSGKLILGICVGMQILFESSEESELASGIGLLRGKIVKLHSNNESRLPHLGWYHTRFTRQEQHSGKYYYVNNYGLNTIEHCDDSALYTQANEDYIGYFRSGNLIGCQFHPEKSGTLGKQLISDIMGAKDGIKQMEIH